MSRVGKKPIQLPNGVQATVNQQTHVLEVKGPLGTLTHTLPSFVNLQVEDAVIQISVNKENDKFQRAIWGTTRAIVANLVQGVSSGFSKEMELNGVGYRMELGNELTLHIGFSHPVKVVIPSLIKLNLQKNLLSGQSIDKQLLGDFFTSIHDMKPCDPYKQKGFKFPGRHYRKKVGKKAK